MIITIDSILKRDVSPTSSFIKLTIADKSFWPRVRLCSAAQPKSGKERILLLRHRLLVFAKEMKHLVIPNRLTWFCRLKHPISSQSCACTNYKGGGVIPYMCYILSMYRPTDGDHYELSCSLVGHRCESKFQIWNGVCNCFGPGSGQKIGILFGVSSSNWKMVNDSWGYSNLWGTYLDSGYSRKQTNN